MTKATAPDKPLPGRRAMSVWNDYADAVILRYMQTTGHKWPLTKYADDPVGFVRDVLHERPMKHQRQIMRAVAKHTKVSVRSGQKTGKTKLLVWLALWGYCCHADAKVVLTAAIKAQIDEVIWSEMTKTIYRARHQHAFDVERPGAKAASGLRAEDGRKIYGFTARDVDSLGGISGEFMLFLIDEASALEQHFFEAFIGNMAGGNCHMLLIGNPIRVVGPFYDSHHSLAKDWKTFHLNSEEIARAVAACGRRIPGVASLSVIEGWAKERGRDDPFFIQRVMGNFVLNEAGRIVQVSYVTAAQAIWADTVAEGTLAIGIDPAGAGETGDCWGFAVVRGNKLLQTISKRGLTEDAAEAFTLALVKQWRRGDEIPRLMIDAEGPLGAPFNGRMKGRAEYLQIVSPGDSFECFGVKASSTAVRESRMYERTRDELWANMAKWMQTAAIPQDRFLEGELIAPGWISNINGKRKASDKKALRELLGRSPDQADALCLAVWDPAPWLLEKGLPRLQPPRADSAPERENEDFDVFNDDDKPSPY